MVVRCPHWPVVVAGAGEGEAVAVLHANRVIARSLAAADAGVRVGQRRREAQARCPGLRLTAHDPAVEAQAFHRVIDAVAEVVPRLELTVPGTITFAARGPSRYYGGDAAAAELVVARARAVLGPSLAAVPAVGVGVADGRFAAGVAARTSTRRGCPEVIPPGMSATMLADIPVEMLTEVAQFDAAVVELFRRLGLARLAQVGALPDADLLARFGRDGVMAGRMARGLDDRPLDAGDPPPGAAVEQSFEPAVPHLDTVVFAARVLAEQMVTHLAAAGHTCTHLAVTVLSERGERLERWWSRPGGLGVAAVVERVRWQLDGWSPSAGVVMLRLDPVEVCADDGMQSGLWGGRSQADEWAQRAVTRLSGLVGDAQVVVAERQGGRQPIDQYRWVPALLTTRFDPTAPDRDALAAERRRGPWPGRVPTPTPAVLHPEPVPVEVLDRRGAPVGVTARGMLSAAPAMLCVGSDAAVAIDAWAGPWLLDERWWDPVSHRRQARFQLVTVDGRALLAVVERRRWWIVGDYA